MLILQILFSSSVLAHSSLLSLLLESHNSSAIFTLMFQQSRFGFRKPKPGAISMKYFDVPPDIDSSQFEQGHL